MRGIVFKEGVLIVLLNGIILRVKIIVTFPTTIVGQQDQEEVLLIFGIHQTDLKRTLTNDFVMKVFV